MKEENALGFQLSVSCPERVNDVETLAVGMCVEARMSESRQGDASPPWSPAHSEHLHVQATRRASAVELVASARSCEADCSFDGLIQTA